MVNADVRINPPDFVSDDPNWVSILGWQGGLENQRGDFVDQSRTARPRSLPHHRTRPGVGYLEDAVAGARRKDVDRGADLPCRGPWHRRGGGARAGVDDPTVRRRDHHPAAGAQPRHAQWCSGRSAAWWCLFCTLVLIGGLSWGAGRINRSEPSGSKAELQPRHRHDRQDLRHRRYLPTTRCCLRFRHSPQR